MKKRTVPCVDKSLGCVRCWLVTELDLAGHCVHCAKVVALAARTVGPTAAELHRVLGED